MERIVIAIAIMALAVGIAALVRRRRGSDPPTQPRREVPSQLDRDDFDRPDARWLVAVFTSETCSTCADVVRKAEVLDAGDTAVVTASFQAARDLHERYRIDVVPMLVIADQAGVVRTAFVGPVSATDLWGAIAELDAPGSTGHGQFGAEL